MIYMHALVGPVVLTQITVDCYRSKTRAAIEAAQGDAQGMASHYEMRAGKRRWNDRMSSGGKKGDD